MGWLASYQGTISQHQIQSAGRQEEDNALSAELLADIFTGLDSEVGEVLDARSVLARRYGRQEKGRRLYSVLARRKKG